MSITTREAKPLLRLLRYARAYRPHMVLAGTCSVLNKLFDIAPEILIGVAIDVVVRRRESFVAAIGITDPNSKSTCSAR